MNANLNPSAILHELVNAWRELDLSTSQYVLSEDKEKLNAKNYVTQKYQQYLEQDLKLENDSRLHLGLLPQPFHGDVLNAPD